jgi:hypothetical protein
MGLPLKFEFYGKDHRGGAVFVCHFDRCFCGDPTGASAFSNGDPSGSGDPAAAIFLGGCQQRYLAGRRRGHFHPALAPFFVFFISLGLPKLMGDLYDPNEWTPAFETMMLGSGGFIIAVNSLGCSRDPKWVQFGAAGGLYLFAMSLMIFAVLHIRYNYYIITLIPGWLPEKVFMSYVVIAAFFLSSFCLFTNIKVRPAMFWLGIMYLSWVGALHAPRAIGKFTVEVEWSSLFVALACAGIAFSIYRRAIDVRSGGVGRLVAVPVQAGG